MTAEPFDRIVECRFREEACALKHVSMSDQVFEHHFPLMPVLPGALLVEGMVRLAAWLLCAGSDFTLTYRLERLRDARFRGFVRPGDRVDLRVTVLGDDRVSATASVDGEVKVRVRELVLGHAPVDPEEREALRRRFRALHE